MADAIDPDETTAAPGGPFADPDEMAELMRDSAEFAANLARAGERTQEIWAKFFDAHPPQVAHPASPDPLNLTPGVAEMLQGWMHNPGRFQDAMMRYWLQQTELWRRSTLKMMGMEEDPVIEPKRGDKRFKDDDWSSHALFDYIKQSYLLTSDFITELAQDAEGLSDRDKRKLNFFTRNFVEAMSPSNFAATNPEVLRATVAERGENLVRGLENMLRDLERGNGELLIRQTDLDAFEVGRDMATTPGKVIFRNDLIELIQYAPTTEQVHAVPLVIIPPWINKFYILDLNEKKSMVRWLVGQGWTVFIASWVNPDEHQAGETWESYMKSGVLTVLEKALEETGEARAHMVGYCVGGTMLGTTLAHMANSKDERTLSATFFTTQLEFSNAGELQCFVDDKALDALEADMQEGFLPAREMATAFNMLRASDLIWSFVVQNYLLGKEPFPFDLLYWNSDSTSMPGKLHRYYLDIFYNRNMLAQGGMTLDGQTLDLSKIRVPSYHLATREDHIAPCGSAYRAAKLMGGRKTYTLAGSGHIAGVVNPPSLQKYMHWTRAGVAADSVEGWAEKAVEHPGSWWPHWDAWLSKHDGSKVAAREPGARLGVLGDAPGKYVKVRFDAN